MSASNKCTWFQDDDGHEPTDKWDSACGESFTLNDGTPSENRMRFCCYCGRPLVERPWRGADAEVNSV
jgi:hypothetical protein